MPAALRVTRGLLDTRGLGRGGGGPGGVAGGAGPGAPGLAGGGVAGAALALGRVVPEMTCLNHSARSAASVSPSLAARRSFLRTGRYMVGSVALNPSRNWV